ncbi:coiled-coil domain-containing protein 124-like [Pomacea canaliculata]|uniref:coiled-coil domain-containing protein 124-like n=1 Tax=Pomacea canaliculata TaxID=400727 RepID=UPI000D72D36E|nr:coiled-coil domain-containing protein 124-like [Pomacea canaliculata]
MPKKFKGENSKAAEARARKEAVKQAETERKQKEEEDALWADEDKHVQRKQQRKETKEKKRVELLEKKKELQRLADEEMSQMKGAKQDTLSKLTRAQIQANRERLEAEAAAAAKKEEDLPYDEKPIEENLNRMVIEGDEARTIDEAISVLRSEDVTVDKHPEKRMKAAYNKFEEENLPRLKAENPNMRLSQLKQMLKKDWMKSPENPMNQRSAAF